MYSFNPYSLLSILVGQINLLVGFIIFFKNPKSLANRLLFLSFLSMSIWGLGEGLERASTSPEIAVFWDSFAVVLGSNFFVAFLLNFWLVFSGEINKFKRKKIVCLLYLPAAVFYILNLAGGGLIATQVVKEYWGYNVQGGTPSYWISMFFIVLYASFVVYLAFRKSAVSTGKIKNQARNIGLGVLFSLFVGLFTDVFSPIFHIGLPGLTALSTLFFNLLIAFTIYRLGSSITPNVADMIFSTMDDYLIAVDKDLKIAIANNALFKNLGLAPTELIGEPLKKFLIGELAESTFEETQKILPITNHSSFLKIKNGAQIPVYMNASLLRDDDDSPSGLVLVLRDARKLNELLDSLKSKTNELEKSKAELEDNVSELKHINELMIDRELKMIELKKKLNEIEKRTAKK